ncbi:MAG: hypothetical protein K2H13_05845, partial [Eubacterium sp.]|nr:hypothetical protein [Eubacterium sp.]
ITDKLTTRFQNNIEKLQNRFDSAVEKARFYFYNPDVLLSRILSTITGLDIKIEFKVLKWLKEHDFVDAQSDDSDDEGFKTFSSKSKKKNSVVGPQGVAVAEILSTIMLVWDALERAGEDFATIIARSITLDKSLLYSNHFSEWYESIFHSFIKFTETDFYQILSYAEALFGMNFFLAFFNKSIERKVNYYRIDIGSILTFFFGVGNPNSAFSDFMSLVTEGKIPLSSGGGLSVGAILDGSYWGYYANSVVNYAVGIYGGINIDFKFKIPDLPNPPNKGGAFALVPNFSYEVNPDVVAGVVGVTAELAAGGTLIYIVFRVLESLAAAGFVFV